MVQDLKDAYFVKNTENGTFTDVTTLFQGVRILKVDGLGSKGESKNVFTQEWVNSETEDMMIVMETDEEPKRILRKNVDIEITFVVRQKYASTVIDVQTQHDLFVDYMTNTDIWIKSNYMGDKFVHCVCLKEYKPTIMKLHRGGNAINNHRNWAMGTIQLHCISPSES